MLNSAVLEASCGGESFLLWTLGMVTLEGYLESCRMRKVTVDVVSPYTFRPLRPPLVRGGLGT